MKVLLLGYRGNPFCGGQGIYMYNLSKELAKMGAEIDVIVGPPYPDSLDEWATTYKTDNLHTWMINTKDISKEKLNRIFNPWNFIDYVLTRFHIFPEMQTFSMRAFFQLRKLLKTERYDIIHDVQSLGYGMIFMKGFNIPLITTVHHPLTRDRDADLMMDKTMWEKIATLLFYPLNMQRIVIKRLNRVITSFVEGSEELNSAFGVDKNKVSVVYNGMDVELFKNSNEPREENALLFVGNTEDHKKGLIYLIEALSLLPEEVTLTIVDEGPPLKNTAFKYVKQFNLENRVTFTGKVEYDKLVSLYCRKTLLVMSSLYEGFGLPAAEAMACKTAVVATAVGALKEIVPETTGILVPPKDPAALKEAILKLLKDKELRKEMGEAGREWVVKNFAWPVAARNTYNVYREVIEEFGRKK